ncbi:MAG: cobalamin B12-binding domain-containing protein [Candidatus Latescibacteria bacterium]|nr:cobalamin B12-binding domain-containing protein [Candidatus Latescibacterota bacterium]
MSGRRIRVLIAKVGLDGHDRGAKVVARALRDAGMEVIYTGLHRTPGEVVNAAIQEDVDVLGISSLSGAHLTIFPKVMDLLAARGADDILVVGGGIMTPADQEALKARGLAFFWGPGTHTGDIAACLREAVK